MPLKNNDVPVSPRIILEVRVPLSPCLLIALFSKDVLHGFDFEQGVKQDNVRRPLVLPAKIKTVSRLRSLLVARQRRR